MMKKQKIANILFKTALAFTIISQTYYLVCHDNIRLVPLIAGLILSVIFWFCSRSKKINQHTVYSVNEEILYRAEDLLESLTAAKHRAKAEDPLLAVKSNDQRKERTQLQLCTMFLITTLVSIRQSHGKIDYVKSHKHTSLIKNITPHIETIYMLRNAKAERIPTLIKNNILKIERVIAEYCVATKQDNDPTIGLHMWFEERSHVSLSGETGILESLLSGANTEEEKALIQQLFQHKKYTTLYEEIRDSTATLVKIFNDTGLKLSNEDDAASQTQEYLSKYINLFLLQLGLIATRESSGDANYFQGMEYKALQAKAGNELRKLLLNTFHMGIKTTESQYQTFLQFTNDQIPLLHQACIDYCESETEEPEQHLFQWLQNAGININQNFALRNYISRSFGFSL